MGTPGYPLGTMPAPRVAPQWGHPGSYPIGTPGYPLGTSGPHWGQCQPLGSHSIGDTWVPHWGQCQPLGSHSMGTHRHPLGTFGHPIRVNASPHSHSPLGSTPALGVTPHGETRIPHGDTRIPHGDSASPWGHSALGTQRYPSMDSQLFPLGYQRPLGVPSPTPPFGPPPIPRGPPIVPSAPHTRRPPSLYKHPRCKYPK